MRVLGLDISLTATGAVLIVEDGTTDAHRLIGTKARGVDRLDAMEKQCVAMACWRHQSGLESPAPAKRGRKAVAA